MTGSVAPTRRHRVVRGAGVLFSFDGRIDRPTFSGLMLAPVALFMAVGLAVVLFLNPLADVSGRTHIERIHRFASINFAVECLTYAMVIWMVLATLAKRWHDFDESGWF